MRRGTTPTHTFTIPFDTAMVDKIEIVYAQGDMEVLRKGTEDCTLEGQTITTQLTQNDTFLFNTANNVQIQLRIMDKDGNVFGSDIMVVSCKKCLSNEVL